MIKSNLNLNLIMYNKIYFVSFWNVTLQINQEILFLKHIIYMSFLIHTVCVAIGH